jgi:hypothetical protein
MQRKYNNNKIHKLKSDQRIDTQQSTRTFYKRIVNLSNVTFTDDDTQLLRKGLKYNLHHTKNCCERRFLLLTLINYAETGCRTPK